MIVPQMKVPMNAHQSASAMEELLRGTRKAAGRCILHCATAIQDRLLHHAITLNIRGNSYRLKDKLKAGLIRTEEPDTVS